MIIDKRQWRRRSRRSNKTPFKICLLPLDRFALGERNLVWEFIVHIPRNNLTTVYCRSLSSECFLLRNPFITSSKQKIPLKYSLGSTISSPKRRRFDLEKQLKVSLVVPNLVNRNFTLHPKSFYVAKCRQSVLEILLAKFSSGSCRCGCSDSTHLPACFHFWHGKTTKFIISLTYVWAALRIARGLLGCGNL